MPGIARIFAGNQGPLVRQIGTPVSTKPATSNGIFNSTVGTSAEKVLSAATSPTGAVRRVKIANPDASKLLAFTVVAKGATAPTLTAGVTGGVATDGSPVPPGAVEWFMVDDATDLYLAGSAAGSPYSLTVSER